jgi:aspartyl-tRNA(Asn)/glutamyl-tRNA(Gln) amidotransferase subunit A
MSELHWMAANAAAAAIANGEMSPVELVEALLDRIERLDPRLNAFLHVDAEAALKEARATEAEAAQGRLRGTLHGVPVGIKDIIDVSGLPTTCHSKILENDVAARTDAECVARLRAAGAIILGKLSTHEFAIGGPSFDLPWPPARNPWNRDHHPGGPNRHTGLSRDAASFRSRLASTTWAR